MIKKKIAIITNIPTPYRRDLFMKLSTLEEFTCKVFFTAYVEHNRHWNYSDFLDYPHIFISGWGIKRKNESVTYINFSLFHYLRQYRPDFIIIGGASISSLSCFIYKQLFGCKLFIWWAGTHLSEAKKSKVVELFRKWLFKRVDGFLCYSHFCEQYLKLFNVRDNDITVIGNNTLDVERYSYGVQNNREKLTGHFYMLVVSQLIQRKNIMHILETFLLISHKYPNIILKITGTGPEDVLLKNFCNSNNLHNVYFLGNLQPEDLKKYYTEADVLLSIAHMDQWPQVVNEAMAYGVPVIASTTSGIDSYFLQEGINGYLVDPEDRETLCRRLEYLILNPDQTRSMGKEASRISRTYDAHHVIRCIEQALLHENPPCP